MDTEGIFYLLRTLHATYDISTSDFRTQKVYRLQPESSGSGSQVVKDSERGWLVTSSSLVSLKTRRAGKLCTLNLSRAQTSSRWCGVVVRRGGASPRHLTVVQMTKVIAISPRVAEQDDFNIHSLTYQPGANPQL
ncbi:hypothetical protein TNCV_920971 [Trichonephila clavipes]|nr:hypothetical protein TNCV_920971 [Trichonephila clavipes]